MSIKYKKLFWQIIVKTACIKYQCWQLEEVVGIDLRTEEMALNEVLEKYMLRPKPKFKKLLLLAMTYDKEEVMSKWKSIKRKFRYSADDCDNVGNYRDSEGPWDYYGAMSEIDLEF